MKQRKERKKNTHTNTQQMLHAHLSADTHNNSLSYTHTFTEKWTKQKLSTFASQQFQMMKVKKRKRKNIENFFTFLVLWTIECALFLLRTAVVVSETYISSGGTRNDGMFCCCCSDVSFSFCNKEITINNRCLKSGSGIETERMMYII